MGSQLWCFVVFCRNFKRTECYTKRKHVYLYMVYWKKYGLLKRIRFIEEKKWFIGKNYGLLDKNMAYLGKNKDVSFGFFAEKEALPILNDEELDFNGETKVTKSGRTTGTTMTWRTTAWPLEWTRLSCRGGTLLSSTAMLSKT